MISQILINLIPNYKGEELQRILFDTFSYVKLNHSSQCNRLIDLDKFGFGSACMHDVKLLQHSKQWTTKRIILFIKIFIISHEFGGQE